MKIKKIITVAFIGLLFANCESTQTKDTPPVAKTHNQSSEPEPAKKDISLDINSMNEQLKQVKITGFKKNQTKLASTPTWLDESYPVFKNVLTELPDGYVLLVRGHCDQSGTQAINQKVSTQRAEYIYNLLVQKGLSRNKIEYKGYAARETIEGLDPLDAKNRRVSFQIIKE